MASECTEDRGFVTACEWSRRRRYIPRVSAARASGGGGGRGRCSGSGGGGGGGSGTLPLARSPPAHCGCVRDARAPPARTPHVKPLY